MLTIFTIPKPFKGHIDIIQRNAIESWLRLEPRCEIILCGDDDGVAEIAAEYNLLHIPALEKTEFGTPLVSSAFEKATELASNRLIMYSNADIIYLNDLLTNLQLADFPQFMMVSQRWDIDIKTRLEITPEYEANLHRLIKADAKLHPPLGSDWFAYPKDTPINMPPFAVGRPAWDNWLLGRMIQQDIPLINVSPHLVTVVHQNHDYAHVPQGDFSKTWDSPESRQNFALIDEGAVLPTLVDSSYVLNQRGIVKVSMLARLWSREIKPRLKPSYIKGVLRSKVALRTRFKALMRMLQNQNKPQ